MLQSIASDYMYTVTTCPTVFRHNQNKTDIQILEQSKIRISPLPLSGLIHQTTNRNSSDDKPIIYFSKKTDFGISCKGDNLHERSNPVFWGKKKIKISSTESFALHSLCWGIKRLKHGTFNWMIFQIYNLKKNNKKNKTTNTKHNPSSNCFSVTNEQKSAKTKSCHNKHAKITQSAHLTPAKSL